MSTNHVIDKNPSWAIGTYNQHGDQNGQNVIKVHHIVAIQITLNQSLILIKLMGDHLSPKCAIGCTSCLPWI